VLLLRCSPNGHVGYFNAVVAGRGKEFTSYVNVLKNIPSRQWNPSDKVWHISVSDYWILRKELEKKGLKAVDVEKPLQELLAQYKQWELGLIELADREDCPLVADPKHLKLDMMPHQRVALDFLLRRKVAINASEMGTGKTFPAIVAARHLKAIGEIKNCLVVCISSVKWNWAREIDKCIDDGEFLVIEGTPQNRSLLWATDCFFKIVNYEILRNDIDTYLANTKFDCIIVDEIHRIRTYKAKQTKALCKLGKKAKYRFGLTGTPIQNKLVDLFSVMRFIHPSLLGEWFPFDRRYHIRGYFGDVVDHRNIDEVHHKLKTVMIRKMKSEVLKDLPPKVYQDQIIELGPAQRRFYNDCLQQVLKSADEEVEQKIKQANILANITYLREVCDSSELIDPTTHHSEKLKELKKIIQELLENGHKVVVFSQFKKMIRIIERDLRIPAITLTGDVSTSGGERDKLVDEFGRSKTKNVFLMTTAGGEGINLQCADYIIFFDLVFNPQVMAQVEDRLHRKGQKSTVNVIRLIAKDTIEDRVLEILRFKTHLFQQVVDGVSGDPVQVKQSEILDAIREMVWQ